MDNAINNNAKEKTEKKIQKIFDKMACKEPQNAIHGTAVAAAGVVALLPIGIDAWALRLCEIYMLMSIYSHYGVKISKSAAESLMTAAFAQAVGETAAYIALEAADAATYATGGLGALPAYGIKLGIATGLIEAVGWTTVKYLEGNKVAEFAIRVADGIGVASDISRVTNGISGACEKDSSVSISSNSDSSSCKITDSLSFTGSKEGSYLGHSESYYRERLKSAIRRGDKVDIKYYTEWLEKAISNRPTNT